MSKHLPTSSTFSKDVSMWGLDKSVVAVYSQDCRSRLDGKKVSTEHYLDWVSGLGAILYGNNDEFTEHLQTQLYAGISFSITNSLEHHVAERLVHRIGSRIPSWDADTTQVRFGKTGTDATTMAVRLARAVTGRDVIISSGYHGWSSEFISAEFPALGIPESYKQHTLKFKFGDISSLWQMIQASRSPACVIMEHPAVDPPEGFYKQVRELCDEYGALLIMDEIVTGLRWGIGGACEYYGIEPDLVCLGKGLGNGVAVSALLGRREYMEWFARTSPPFCSSTFWGETLGLAAANWMLQNWTEENVEYIWEIGGQLMNDMREAGYDIIGHPPRSLLKFENNLYRSYFIQQMFKRGIMMNRPNFPTLSHSMVDIQKTVVAAQEVYEKMQKLSKKKLKKIRQAKVLFEER